MDDGEALIRAIELFPAEDVPKLAFADWLNEQGRDQHAELVRVQVELGRLQEALPLLQPSEVELLSPADRSMFIEPYPPVEFRMMLSNDRVRPVEIRSFRTSAQRLAVRCLLREARFGSLVRPCLVEIESLRTRTTLRQISLDAGVFDGGSFFGLLIETPTIDHTPYSQHWSEGTFVCKIAPTDDVPLDHLTRRDLRRREAELLRFVSIVPSSRTHRSTEPPADPHLPWRHYSLTFS